MNNASSQKVPILTTKVVWLANVSESDQSAIVGEVEKRIKGRQDSDVRRKEFTDLLAALRGEGLAMLFHEHLNVELLRNWFAESVAGGHAQRTKIEFNTWKALRAIVAVT